MTQSAFVACDEKVVGTNRPRVLLGDDHVPFNDKLRSLLTPHFDVVGAAHDGEEVIAAAQRLRPDVIVLDISMPVLNGLKAARRLKETGMLTKIVFCTMHADATFVREAFDAGATGYVVKTAAAVPVHPSVSRRIASSVEEVLGRFSDSECRRRLVDVSSASITIS